MEFFEETIQTGFEPSGIKRVGFADGPRRKLTPNEIAGNRLLKTLEKYPDFTQDARIDIYNEFIDFPDLPVINLETFVAVLAFLKRYPQPVKKNFSDKNILPYFSRLMPTKKISSEEKERIILRLKAEFIKYVIAIGNYRREEE